MTTITTTEAFTTGRYVNLGSPASQDDIAAQTIIAYCKPTASGGGGFGYLFSKTVSGGPNGIRLYIDHNAGNPKLASGTNSTTSPALPEKAGAANEVVYNSWQHYTLAWDGSVAHTGISLYVGATECTYSLGSSGTGSLVSDAANDVFIANRGGLVREFVGDMAYIARWSRVLDSTERALVISDGPLAVPTGLILCWANDQDYSTNAITASSRSSRVTGSTPPNTAMGDAGGDQTLTPSLYTNSNTFYSPSLSYDQTLTPGLYTNTNAFYSATVSLSGGAQSLTPGLFSNANTFHAATVARVPGFLTPVLKNNTGTVLASETGVACNVYNSTTGALVVRKTGLTSSAAGIVSVTDAAMAAGTTYAYEIVLSAARRLPVAAA